MRATSLLVFALLSFTSGIQIRSLADPATPAAASATADAAAAPATADAAAKPEAAEAAKGKPKGTNYGWTEPVVTGATSAAPHSADEAWVANMSDKAFNKPHGPLEYQNA